jgi:hypothetical protein
MRVSPLNRIARSKLMLLGFAGMLTCAASAASEETRGVESVVPAAVPNIADIHVKLDRTPLHSVIAILEELSGRTFVCFSLCDAVVTYAAAGKPLPQVAAEIGALIGAEVRQQESMTLFLAPHEDYQAPNLEGPGVRFGARISIDAKDMDLRTLLQIIAKASRMEFSLASDEPIRVNLQMRNVRWEDALGVILMKHKLALDGPYGNLYALRPIGEELSHGSVEPDQDTARKREHNVP